MISLEDLKDEESINVVESELTKNELRYIIDVSRPDSEEELNEFFQTVQPKLFIKATNTHSYKQLNLKNGLDYSKDYPELALKLNKNIVLHRERIDDPSSKQILILPKVWEHPIKRFPEAN